MLKNVRERKTALKCFSTLFSLFFHSMILILILPSPFYCRNISKYSGLIAICATETGLEWGLPLVNAYTGMDDSRIRVCLKVIEDFSDA